MTRWFYLSILLTLAALAGSLYVYQFRYDDLPDQVPIHWNIHGQPDGFVPKSDVFMTFLLMPAVMAGIVLLSVLLPWLSPKNYKVDAFRGVWDYLMMLVTALFGYIQLIMLWGSLVPLAMDRLLIVGMCLFFALIGSVMGKVRRNFWMGVRTPWTLANEEVWDRTHQLTAWLFTVGGLVGVLVGVAGLPLWLCFVGIIGAALVPVFYSLVLYKVMEKQGKV
jgi:uncharacterized membrane protein